MPRAIVFAGRRRPRGSGGVLGRDRPSRAPGTALVADGRALRFRQDFGGKADMFGAQDRQVAPTAFLP